VVLSSLAKPRMKNPVTTGGTPATVIVTIDADTLIRRTGDKVTSDGTALPVAEVLRPAGEADILPAVLTTSGVLLELGCTRRAANQNQTYALIARDGGSSFPGCGRPPQWCDRHHVQAWIEGGRTDPNQQPLINDRIRAQHVFAAQTLSVGLGRAARLR
jgi:hypothetical protein